MTDDETTKGNGPTLRTYLETRLNLIQHAQEEVHVALRAEFTAALAAADIRYTQRFEAQSKALDAAFVVAEKAVGAALAAADRAVSKSEVADDKRFEALGTEVLQRANVITEKIDSVTKRLDAVEGRANTANGESVGNRRTKDDTRLWVGVALTFIMVVLGLATFFIARMGPP